MSDVRIRLSALAAALALVACGGSGETAQQQEPARDLSLAPAESTRAVNDRPAQPRPEQPRTQTRRQPTPPPRQQTPQPPPARPEPPATPSVAEGTSIDLFAADSINSRRNKKGDMIMATVSGAVKDASGRDVIPAGAIFSGTISDIHEAERPGGQGRMVLTFNKVSFGGKNYAVQARTDSLATTMKGQGITGKEAVKVGAATAIGAVAGRLIGGNAKGTAIGAAAGAAAGTGYALATRDVDIILPAGALVRIVLTAEFKAEPLVD